MYWFHCAMVALSVLSMMVVVIASTLLYKMDPQSVFGAAITLALFDMQLGLVIIVCLQQTGDTLCQKYSSYAKPAMVCSILADTLHVLLVVLSIGTWSDSMYNLSMRLSTTIILSIAFTCAFFRLLSSVSWLSSQQQPKRTGTILEHEITLPMIPQRAEHHYAAYTIEEDEARDDIECDIRYKQHNDEDSNADREPLQTDEV